MIIKKHMIILLLVAFSTVLAIDGKQKYTDIITPLPQGVSIYQLDNGMEVLLIEKPGLPMTGVNVVVKVGSAYESFASSGMSHMLEHLLFNGTETMKQKELYDAVDLIGGYNNANTDRYYTNYMMVTPHENIEKGMKIQAGMLFHSILPEEKFSKEKGIVLEEIAKSLGKPAEQINRNIISILYPGHALSLPTLGTYETIKGMSRDDVFAFYKNFYVPNNMRMSVVGDFNSEDMLKMIMNIYGSAKPGNVSMKDNLRWQTAFQPIKTDNLDKTEVFHRFYKGKDIKLQLFYDIPAKQNNEYYELLDGDLEKTKSELETKLLKEYPLVVKAVHLNTMISPVASHLQITIDILKNESFDPLVKEISSWLSARDFSISPGNLEVEVVKSRTEFIRNTEKPHMFGIFNAGTIATKGFLPITEAFLGNGFYEAAAGLKKLHVSGSPLVIMQYPQIKENTENEKSASVTTINKGDEKAPVMIVREVPNGDILAIHFLLGHKSFYEDKYGKNAAKIWHEAFGSRMKKLVKEGDNYKYGFTFTVNDNPWIPMDDIYLHPDFAYIRVEALADNIEGAIKFITTQMYSFVPTLDEFTKAMGSIQRSSMMRGQNKAKSVFTKTWKDIVYEKQESPSNEKLTYQSLLEFGKSYFRAGNMIISVVSPATNDEIRGYFSNFKSNGSSLDEKIPAWSRNFKFSDKPITIEKKEDGEQTYLFYGFMKKTEKNDEAALTALNLLLKDDIVFDIREKKGMAYRMSAGIDQNNGIALFYIRFGTRPQNAEVIRPLFPSYFDPEFSDKINVEDLQKAINMYLGRMMFRRLSSINQGFYLGESYYLYGDYEADQKKLESLKNVNIDDVKRVAEKYLDVENPILIEVK